MPNWTQSEWDDLMAHAQALSESDVHFQESMYYFRAKQGLTLADMAAKLGTTQDKVTEIEIGDPTLSDLRAYALAIGMDIVHTIKIRNKNDHEQDTHRYLAHNSPE